MKILNVKIGTRFSTSFAIIRTPASDQLPVVITLTANQIGQALARCCPDA